MAGNELIKRIKMVSGRKEVGGDNVYICNKCRYHPKMESYQHQECGYNQVRRHSYEVIWNEKARLFLISYKKFD